MPGNLSYSLIEGLKGFGISSGPGYSRAGGTDSTPGVNNINTSNTSTNLNKTRNFNNNNISLEDTKTDAEESIARRRLKEKVSLIDESKKIIKVAYPLYGEPMSYLSLTGAKDGLTFRAWEEVDRIMKKNGTEYKLEYIVIKEPETDKLVEDLKSRKYDLIIGDYGTNPNFLDSVSYSSPFMSVKDVGVYLADSDTQYEYRLIRKIVSVLIWPFLGLIVLSLLSSLYAWMFSKKINFAGAFVQMMNAILGDRGSLMSGSSYKVSPGKTLASWALSILIVIVSFVFLFYLQSIAISKSLDVISKNKDPFMFPEGKKVLVPRGSTALQNLRNCCGINTVESKSKTTDVNSLAKEFVERRKKEKLSGFYTSGPEVSKWIGNNPDFVMSDTKFSNPSPVSFMVSKYRPELLYEINKAMAEINWNALLKSKCKEYVNRLCFSSQY